MSEGTPGELVLAGTPIGDVADASPALLAALTSANVIAAEDTRKLRDLAARLGIAIEAKVVSHFEGNEAARAQALVAEIAAGARVVVVTDAGMPLVSDPGFRLVNAVIEAGMKVRVVPGPSAVLAALAVSGLPTDRFCFEGFLPRKAGERSRRLAELATEPRTMIFFEAPHRLGAALTGMSDAFGAGRPAAVCRELTKTYEEIRRGPLADLAGWAAAGVRGEITVVVGGAPAEELDPALAAALVAELVEAGATFRSAVDEVAAERGWPRKAVYAAALALRRAPSTTPLAANAPRSAASLPTLAPGAQHHQDPHE